MNRFIVIAAAAVFFGACDLTENRALFQRAAQLRTATTDSIVFTAPDSVALSASFDVTVHSYGGGCERKGPTNMVKFSEDSANFLPLDITESTGEICTTELKTFVHTAPLSFSTSGSKPVSVYGRDATGGPMVRTRNVFVKP
jgi:hypothetical protein